jgi:hypothetical protein
MAGTNILGYTRTKDANRLISSDFAGLSLDNEGTLGLVQQATVNYGHNVTPRFEAGSSELYWLAGQAQGSVQIGRSVTNSGFFSGLTPQNAAQGKFIDFTLDINKSNSGFSGAQDAATSVSANAKKTLTFKGGIISAIGATVATGSLDVSESVTINFADMVGGAAK